MHSLQSFLLRKNDILVSVVRHGIDNVVPHTYVVSRRYAAAVFTGNDLGEKLVFKARSLEDC